jgi:hypothetical protein
MDERLSQWRCECGRADCVAVVHATMSERDEVDHSAETLWLVVPEHVGPDDHVVRTSPRFAVVKAGRFCDEPLSGDADGG